jgi:hypothetical protein
MATTRPFSRYTGGPISNNAEQIGNLYFGNENTLLEVGGVKWWNGPDEDSGYVIAYEDAAGGHIGADSVQAYLGFKRSAAKTEASFIQLATKVTGESFATGDEAKTYLNANGYWTSYGEVGAGWFFYSAEGPLIDTQPPIENGNSIFLTVGGNATFNPNTSSGTNQLYFNRYDNSGIDYNTQFDDLRTNGGVIHVTQNGQTVSYSGAANAFQYDNGTNPPYFDFLMINGNYATQLGSASPFVSGDPIILTFN